MWSKISNVLKSLGFRSHNFLTQLVSETSRACTIWVRRSSLRRLWNDLGSHACLHHRNRRPGTTTEERISDRREPDPESPNQRQVAVIRCRKATLAEIAHRLGRKALEELAAVAKPDTLLAWYRKLIANKFDGSKFRKSYASHPTTGNWRHEDFHLARFAALSAAPYGPVLLRRPFGFHLAMDTLPSELQQAVASGRSWLCPASPSCPFRRLHTFRFLRPARLITPLLDMAPLI